MRTRRTTGTRIVGFLGLVAAAILAASATWAGGPDAPYLPDYPFGEPGTLDHPNGHDGMPGFWDPDGDGVNNNPNFPNGGAGGDALPGSGGNGGSGGDGAPGGDGGSGGGNGGKAP